MKKVTLLQATSIAVGTMIGASIFSVFGLGARIAGHNLPFVFVIAGLVALLVAYSYAVLGKRIVSNAGPIEFILRGFGDNTLTGALSILLWLSYVISMALFVKGFAGYFIPLVHLPGGALSFGAVETVVILVFLALNLAGSQNVGRAEFIIVMIKLGILGIFVFLGVSSIRPEWITPAFNEQAMDGTLVATSVFFLSYMGFGLVTNVSEDMVDPEHNVPRAIYLSILIVSVVYISVAAVALGNLPLDRLVKAQDFALAEAAKPFLGSAGYVLVSIGALFSISSALNATLYGGANIAYALARDGELPDFFERKTWFQAKEGLYITAVLAILLALLFNLDGIASITSAVFMAIYLFVLASHFKLAPKYGGFRPLIVLGFVTIVCIFVVLMIHLWQTGRDSFWFIWITFGSSLVIEAVYRSKSGRTLVVREFERIRKLLP